MLKKLIAPSPLLLDPTERTHARILAALSLIQIPISGIVLLMTTFMEIPEEPRNLWMVNVTATILDVLAYALSRTRHYRLACHLLMLITSGSITAALLMARDSAQTATILPWLLVSTLISSLVLTMRSSITWSISLAAYFAVFSFTLGGSKAQYSAFALLFYLITSSLVLIGSHLLRTAERERNETLQRVVMSARLSSIGEMAAGVAHEINNPLTIILMHAELLETKAQRGELSSQAAGEAGVKIQKTSRRIARIVRSLQIIGRDAGKDPMERMVLGPLVSDTLELCSERIRRQGIQLEVDPIDDALRVNCRPTEISQILLNLINNAFDAVEKQKDGWIRVSVHELRADVEVSVSNNGPEIPKELRERVMEPFFTTKPFGKGTGLGLSISHGLALANGGSLRIDSISAPVRFVLRLPRSG